MGYGKQDRKEELREVRQDQAPGPVLLDQGNEGLSQLLQALPSRLHAIQGPPEGQGD